MYVGLGIVFLAIGLIAVAVVDLSPWIAAMLILLGALAMIAAVLLPDPLRRRSRDDYPTLG